MHVSFEHLISDFPNLGVLIPKVILEFNSLRRETFFFLNFSLQWSGFSPEYPEKTHLCKRCHPIDGFGRWLWRTGGPTLRLSISLSLPSWFIHHKPLRGYKNAPPLPSPLYIKTDNTSPPPCHIIRHDTWATALTTTVASASFMAKWMSDYLHGALQNVVIRSKQIHTSNHLFPIAEWKCHESVLPSHKKCFTK